MWLTRANDAVGLVYSTFLCFPAAHLLLRPHQHSAEQCITNHSITHILRINLSWLGTFSEKRPWGPAARAGQRRGMARMQRAVAFAISLAPDRRIVLSLMSVSLRAAFVVISPWQLHTSTAIKRRHISQDQYSAWISTRINHSGTRCGLVTCEYRKLAPVIYTPPWFVSRLLIS